MHATSVSEQEPRELKRRGDGFGTEMRKLEKLIADLAAELPFADDYADKAQKNIARVLAAYRLEKEHDRKDDEFVRAWLNTKFNGRVESATRKLLDPALEDETTKHDNERARAVFRRKAWRV